MKKIKVCVTVIGKCFSREVDETRSINKAFELVYRDALTYLTNFAARDKNKYGLPNCYKDSKIYAGNVWIGVLQRNGEVNPNGKYLTEESRNAILTELSPREKAAQTSNDRFRLIKFDENKILTVAETAVKPVEVEDKKSTPKQTEMKAHYVDKLVSMISKDQLALAKEEIRFSLDKAVEAYNRDVEERGEALEFNAKRRAMLTSLMGILNTVETMKKVCK
jgi:hypothetical protein